MHQLIIFKVFAQIDFVLGCFDPPLPTSWLIRKSFLNQISKLLLSDHRIPHFYFPGQPWPQLALLQPDGSTLAGCYWGHPHHHYCLPNPGYQEIGKEERQKKRFPCQVVYTLYCVMVDSRREGWLIQKCLRLENSNIRQCWQRTGSSVCSTGHFVRIYSLLNSNFYTGQTCRYGTSNVVFVSENSNSVVGSVTPSLQVKDAWWYQWYPKQSFFLLLIY